MALRNAFANLVTESVTGIIETILDRMDERLARQALMEQPRDLQYARTINDAMRVNIDGANVIPMAATVGGTWQNPGTTGPANFGFKPWFDSNATYMVDEREQQRIQTEQQFNQVRTQRWVIS